MFAQRYVDILAGFLCDADANVASSDHASQHPEQDGSGKYPIQNNIGHSADVSIDYAQGDR